MKNSYKIDKEKNLVSIELHNKHLGVLNTIIDYEDFEKVNQYKTTWFIGYGKGHIDGVKTKVQKKKTRVPIWMHRLIMDCPKNLVIDHINGDTLDNRKSNLRIVTSQENSTNLSSKGKGKSGYTNIYLEDGRYRVRIHQTSFGCYKTLEEAIEVRNEHLKEVFPLRER